MPPITNQLSITVICTCATLIAGSVFIVFKQAADNRKFRKNLQPGDYANIETKEGLVRCKLINKYEDQFLFKILNSREAIITQKSKIYQP